MKPSTTTEIINICHLQTLPPAPLPISGGKNTQYVSCRLVTYGLYYVEMDYTFRGFISDKEKLTAKKIFGSLWRFY